MYIHQCPECGKQFSTIDKVNRVKCPYCGNETNVSYAEQQQPNQGQWQQAYNNQPYHSNDVFATGPSGKSRGVAGLLAVLLGAIGVHYFYLNKPTGGIVFLILTLLTCGILGVVTQVVSIIQGVLLFTCTEEEFEQKWCNPANSFPLF
ncbi:MAG: NINE protein [Muribaculaceae bacterium]|nr:NINE protein [Muribaculaceae bacterium]MBR5685322.1 NINE protein [Muribaculaceae bacterium]